MKVQDQKIQVHPEHEDLAALANQGFDALWQDLQGPVLDRNRLRRVEFVEWNGEAFYLKRFLGIQWKNAVKLRFRERPHCQSQAFREALVIERLRNLGFHPPSLLLAAEETRLGHEQRSLLATAPLPGLSLSELYRDRPMPQELLLRCAETFGKILRAGIYLPDLGLDHCFLLQGDHLGLIDFHNARFSPAPRQRDLARALAHWFKSPGGSQLWDQVVPFTEAYLRAAELSQWIPGVLFRLQRRLGS